MSSGRCLSLIYKKRANSLVSKPLIRLGQVRFNSSTDGPKKHTLSKFTGASNGLPFDIPSQTTSVAIKACSSCGIHLQETNENEPGFYKKGNYKKATINQTDLQFMKAFGNLDEEGKKLLQAEMGISNIDLNRERNLEAKRGNLDDDEEMYNSKCKRCYDSIFHGKFSLEEGRKSNFDEVMNSIPQNSEMFHVASAYDFPLGLIDYGKSKRVSYIINKIDLLFPTPKSPKAHAERYFEVLTERLTGSKKVQVISAFNQWGLAEVLDKLPSISYLIGYVNSGKSLLALKLKNEAVHRYDEKKPWAKPIGSSFVPALTQETIETDLISKTTHDTPGILPPVTAYDSVKREHVKQFLGGEAMIADRIKRMKYISVHGGECYTNGGLFYLIPPEGSLLQVRCPVKGNPRVFRDFERAKEIARDPPNGVKNIFVKPESVDKLIRYVIPPFLGKIDLLIKDYGFVQITPTGAKSTDELFEVWAPEGVVMGVRRAIVDFVTRSQPLDRKRRAILREDKRTPRSVVAKGIPNDKLFSRLYEIPADCEDARAEMESQYKIYEREDAHSKFNFDSPKRDPNFKYWIEKL